MAHASASSSVGADKPPHISSHCVVPHSQVIGQRMRQLAPVLGLTNRPDSLVRVVTLVPELLSTRVAVVGAHLQVWSVRVRGADVGFVVCVEGVHGI